ncbi:MAG: metal-dependent hydrolase [Flavobacteriales bacterium]|nr:metal-dependent hydrolase [Flavobacteriales bacterium]
MDSLTQIVLGAAVGEVVLGRKVGNKAILWGAIAGTIPDLDVLARSLFDPLRANEIHRGITHSILFSAAMAPVLALAEAAHGIAALRVRPARRAHLRAGHRELDHARRAARGHCGHHRTHLPPQAQR